MAKLKYLGHSAFYIEGENIKALIDPFLTGNPWDVASAEDFKSIDYIFVTHGHADHLGDTIEISKRTNATVVSVYEVGVYCSSKGANTHNMHIGGTFSFPFGRVKLTTASHGSSAIEGNEIVYLGNPCGFIIEIEGKNIYHAGDTGLIADMELIGKYENIHIALLPIGGNFTMDIKDAIISAQMIKPDMVIPMHYKTWPLIEAEPEEFKKALEEKGINVKVLNPGDSMEF